MSDIDQAKEENIRIRAFLLWEIEGQQGGKGDEYWHRARERIDAEAQSAYPPRQSSAHRT